MRSILLSLPLLALVTAVACKSEEPSSKQSASTEGDGNTAAAKDAKGATTAGEEADATAEKAGAEGDAAADTGDASPKPLTLDCGNADVWEAYPLKHLKTGAIMKTVEGVEMPELEWESWQGVDHAERLKLPESAKVLAVGASGSKQRVVVSQTCGDDTMVTVYPPKGPATLAFLAQDMAFDSAVAGGDRVLLGGMARHPSENAAAGFVPREYLLTLREGKFFKIEPARNKSAFVPTAAASQIVQVTTDGSRCTSMFWKLGVGDCDFEGPQNDVFALLGANMIYQAPETKKGMVWSVKEGHRDLLPRLDWIVSDGVNLVWSNGDHAFTTQPSWKIEKLSAEPLAGPAGNKPLAVGCGRSLAFDGTHWILRNLKKGNYWSLPADFVPDEIDGDAIMSCDAVTFSSGNRILVKNLGTLKTFEAEEADAKETEEADAPEAPADAPEAPADAKAPDATTAPADAKAPAKPATSDDATAKTPAPSAPAE